MPSSEIGQRWMAQGRCWSALLPCCAVFRQRPFLWHILERAEWPIRRGCPRQISNRGVPVHCYIIPGNLVSHRSPSSLVTLVHPIAVMRRSLAKVTAAPAPCFLMSAARSRDPDRPQVRHSTAMTGSSTSRSVDVRSSGDLLRLNGLLHDPGTTKTGSDPATALERLAVAPLADLNARGARGSETGLV